MLYKLQAVFYSVLNLGSFSVIEPVERAYKVSGYSSDTLEAYLMFFLGTSALRTYISYDTRISAARVTVNRVVDRAVAYSAFFHAADYLLKSREILQRDRDKLELVAGFLLEHETMDARQFQLVYDDPAALAPPPETEGD